MTTAPRLSVDVLTEKARALGDHTKLAIAQRTGVQESTISRLMALRTRPSLDTLHAIAKAYETTMDELITTDGAPVASVPAQRDEAA
ncbi:helix-turn-helix transcriptional regulator [Streptomyces sp. NPDC012617]|uniref:helix-turn-helix domain-containing protein n=1 Tax=Streptomyces TaxID=1883 RepID=UPI0034044D38